MLHFDVPFAYYLPSLLTSPQRRIVCTTNKILRLVFFFSTDCIQPLITYSYTLFPCFLFIYSYYKTIPTLSLVPCPPRQAVTSLSISWSWWTCRSRATRQFSTSSSWLCCSLWETFSWGSILSRWGSSPSGGFTASSCGGDFLA